MKLLYIAGPYTASNAWDLEQNIRRAEELALKVADLGYSALCPHTQSRYFFGTLPEEYWLKATMRQMIACDGVVLVEGWEKSPGTKGEVEEAIRRGIPVYYNIKELIR